MNIATFTSVLILALAPPRGPSAEASASKATGKGAVATSNGQALEASADLVAGVPVVTVVGERLTLGDITSTLPRDLAGLDLGPSPMPGQRLMMYRQAFRSAMERVGVDPGLANGLPALVQVERPGQVLDENQLSQDIAKEAEQLLPLGVSVREVLGTKAQILPQGSYTVEVNLGKLHRSTHATIRVRANGRVWAMQSVQLVLDGQAMAPVLRRNLPAKAVVAPQDVQMIATELEAIPEGGALRSQQLSGKQLTSAARAGQVLAQTTLQEPPMIVRGLEVNLLAMAPGISIFQPAIAEEDGKFGEWIRVRPISGTRQLRAKVISSGEVQIDLGNISNGRQNPSITASAQVQQGMP
jgi:flagella basal body P-ring formation protein FlgA